MPNYNSSSAYSHAIALVTAGLQSGSIKLMGPSHGTNSGIKTDSDYLNAVINALAKNLQTTTPGE